jgi:hypothetical protein
MRQRAPGRHARPPPLLRLRQRARGRCGGLLHSLTVAAATSRTTRDRLSDPDPCRERLRRRLAPVGGMRRKLTAIGARAAPPGRRVEIFCAWQWWISEGEMGGRRRLLTYSSLWRCSDRCVFLLLNAKRGPAMWAQLSLQACFTAQRCE